MIFATNNNGKLREIKEILKNYEIYSLKEKNIVIINENKTTKFDYNSQTYYIVSIEDVLLVLED